MRRHGQAILAVIGKLAARTAALRARPRKSPPPRARTVEPLDLINDSFHATYDQARSAAKQEGPVFVVLADELIVFDSQRRQAFSFAPPAFHVIKSVAHAPVALYAMFARSTSRTELAEARRRVVTALEGTALSTAETSHARADMELILRACRDFIDGTIGEGASPQRLDAFAASTGAALLRLAHDATRLQLQALHDHTERALHALSASQREQLHVVIAGDHQARVRSLAMQYFRKRFAEPAGAETRVTYAEGVNDERAALDLVGTQRLDRSIARAFFGEETRLQRDILGDAAEALLRSFAFSVDDATTRPSAR
jgi:hypothetical protein